MRVKHLIELLQQQDPETVVVLWDQTASAQPAVARLGMGEVLPIRLRPFESMGLVWYEPAIPAESGETVPGVVIGELCSKKINWWD